MNINDRVFFRYEPYIAGGTLVIYNYSNGDIFEGDFEIYSIMAYIEANPGCTVEDVEKETNIEQTALVEYIAALKEAKILV